MFQSRNRESYLFKVRGIRAEFGCPISRFNLVIENLIFSSHLECECCVGLDFLFQSRNRESYLFKFHTTPHQTATLSRGFNLVIENLIFSSLDSANTDANNKKFQSRNRESYLFKSGGIELAAAIESGFNLVIENLIFSKNAPTNH